MILADDDTTILENIDWDNLESVREAIDAALANGAHAKAMALIAEGRQRFPEDGGLQNLARILAPPKVLRRNVPASPGIGRTVRWLKTHQTEYSGQWVALKDGVLLGHHASRPELSKLLADVDTSDMLITKIPD